MVETEGIEEMKDFSFEDHSLIFHWTKEGGVILDRRSEHEIAIQRKLKETNCATYSELKQYRAFLNFKKRGNEILTPEQEKALELAVPTEADKAEASKYKSFDEYVEVNKCK